MDCIGLHMGPVLLVPGTDIHWGVRRAGLATCPHARAPHTGPPRSRHLVPLMTP